VSDLDPENNLHSQEAKHAAEVPDQSVLAPPPGGEPASDTYALRWRDLAYIGLFYLIVGVALVKTAVVVASSILHTTEKGLQQFPGAYVAAAAISQALLSVFVLIFLWLLVRSRGPAPFWPAVGWRSFPAGWPRAASIAQYLLLGGALMVAIQFVGSYMHMPSQLPIDQMLRNRSSVLMMTALGILEAPLIEETLFRGCIYPVIARTFGVTTGIAATGILFGLAHGLQLSFAWQPVLLLSIVGIVLTYIRARAGTVLASFLVHLGYNSLLFGAFYLATGGLRNFPGS
jgi:membrane protease YdiL (CAAX protease family)